MILLQGTSQRNRLESQWTYTSKNMLMICLVLSNDEYVNIFLQTKYYSYSLI